MVSLGTGISATVASTALFCQGFGLKSLNIDVLDFNERGKALDVMVAGYYFILSTSARFIANPHVFGDIFINGARYPSGSRLKCNMKPKAVLVAKHFRKKTK